MKPILVLAAYSLKMFLRDRGALFWGILFPLLLMGLIGLVFGNTNKVEFTVAVVDEAGGSPLAAGIKDGIRAVPVFRVTEEGREGAMKALKAGDRSLVVVLPPPAPAAPAAPGVPAAPAPYRVEAFYDEGKAQVSQAALSILDKVVSEVNLRAVGASRIVDVTSRGTSTRRLSLFDFLLPGIMAMTIMQSGLMGVTWVVANYREKLVLKRVLTAPVRPSTFFAGLVARFTIVQFVQVTIIFLVATFVFHAKTVGSLAVLALLSVLGSVAFLGIGFAVSTVSKTPEAANNLGSLLNFPMMFLSGTFWPREMIPDALQPVVAALPLTPLVEAMRGVGARGEPLTGFLPGLAYLLAWGAAGFLLSARYFRHE